MIQKHSLFIIILLLVLSYKKGISRQTNFSILDTSILKNWESLTEGHGIISNNGVYVGYSISSSVYTIYKPSKQIFKSLKTCWEVCLDSVYGQAYISEDSRYGIVLLRNNRLCIQELGKNRQDIIPQVKSFVLQTVMNQQYLIYFKIGEANEVIFRNLKNGTEKRYENVLKYNFPKQGDCCYILSKEKGLFKIDMLELFPGKRKNIWSGVDEPSSLITDITGNHLCFLAGSNILYWERASRQDIKILAFKMVGDCKGLKVTGPAYFSSSGHLLFLKMTGDVLLPVDEKVNPVQIFSYQDGVFDMNAERFQQAYLGIYNIDNGSITRLENENEHFRSLSVDGKIALVSNREGDPAEYYWNRKGWYSHYVINLSSRERILIEKKAGITELSPLGKFVLYQNDWQGDFYCKNIHTGDVICLTNTLPIPLKDDITETPMCRNSRSLFFYSWANNDSVVIIYDRYDIWMLDVNGKKAPINLTNGYGRKHHIVFRFCQPANKDEINDPNTRDIVISAFNEENKDNGFYCLRGISGKDPFLLTMGPFVYVAPYQNVSNFPPIKAKDKAIWMVWRMSTRSSPNYYWTKDFKKFKEISNIHPEKKYQWHSAELINFKTKAGINTQAVLYKPENFDSAKKYPVLFNYYEIESAKLNAFKVPGFTTDGYWFNYPMMLARGYLVCLTDIHFGEGEPARNIVDAVEGAGEYLSKRPYIDSSHYGLCSGSLGGYETNCLATFSHKFSAAVAISAPSDLISAYGNVPGLRDEEYENRQYRMGVSLSSNPEHYLSNSPVAYTKGVTTPILIVNSSIDWNVNIQQGIEFFISLRREGKPAWMLQYQHPGHGIEDISDRRDLYTRMNQFFDHYLKGKPAPLWMTGGVQNAEISIK